MAKKKELDNLSLDMIRCKADGFGCHYGQWKALQGEPVKVEEEVEEPTPQGWLICKQCGKPFKPRTKRKQYYCEAGCQRAAQNERDNERRKKYYREYQERKRKEQKNESYA